MKIKKINKVLIEIQISAIIVISPTRKNPGLMTKTEALGQTAHFSFYSN